MSGCDLQVTHSPRLNQTLSFLTAHPAHGIIGRQPLGLLIVTPRFTENLTRPDLSFQFDSLDALTTLSVVKSVFIAQPLTLYLTIIDCLPPCSDLYTANFLITVLTFIHHFLS